MLEGPSQPPHSHLSRLALTICSPALTQLPWLCSMPMAVEVPLQSLIPHACRLSQKTCLLMTHPPVGTWTATLSRAAWGIGLLQITKVRAQQQVLECCPGHRLQPV